MPITPKLFTPMKNLITLLSILFISNLSAQQSRDIAFHLKGGVNLSDMNYGTEVIFAILPTADYGGYSLEGSDSEGFHFGIGSTVNLYKRLSANLDIDFHRFNYDAGGDVEALRFDVNRPLSSSIPIALDGTINYDFLSIQAGMQYSFNDNARQGMYVSGLLSHHIHLKTDVQLNAVFEDLSRGTVNSLAGVEQPNYNNLWMVGLGLGYDFKINETLSLAPEVEFQYGLNTIADDEIVEPTTLTGSLTLKKWF